MYINIFVTNLGKYNEGFLIGEWVSLPCDDLQAVYKRIGINEHYEEMFISDYESDLELEIREYTNIDELNKVAKTLSELDGNSVDIINAYLYHGYDINEAIQEIEAGNYSFFPGCNDFSDLAYDMLENGYFGDIPDNIRFYIDLEKLGQTIECEGTFYFSDAGCVEIL